MTEKETNIIIGAAMQPESIAGKVKELKNITFCTDEEKFELLNNALPPEQYSDIFEAYFNEKPEYVKAMSKDTNPHLPRTKFLTEPQIRKIITMFIDGTDPEEIGRCFDRTEKQIRQLVTNCKQRKKYMDMFTDKPLSISENEAPETDTETTALPDELPDMITAKGSGRLTTDRGLMIDDEPITAAIRQKLIEMGIAQMYADVEITIRPAAPKGMTVEIA